MARSKEFLELESELEQAQKRIKRLHWESGLAMLKVRYKIGDDDYRRRLAGILDELPCSTQWVM